MTADKQKLEKLLDTVIDVSVIDIPREHRTDFQNKMKDCPTYLIAMNAMQIAVNSERRKFVQELKSLAETFSRADQVQDYWKERCLAAEEFIAKTPSDNDCTDDQIKAYGEWQKCKIEQS